MRKRIYEIIERSNGNDRWSSVYDWFMLVLIFASLVPLAFKTERLLFQVIDKGCLVVFSVDYLLRLATADYKYGRKSVFSFLRYPFSLMAIVDLVAILPSLSILNSGWKMLRVLRMFRALRVFRVFKAFRYSRSVRIVVGVFRTSREPLIAVGTLAAAYILISALVIFNVEPDTFATFFDAVYWATVSLTTVGYGDIFPVTATGKIITMLSSVFGIAIVALPAGVITAGYMEAISGEEDGEVPVRGDPRRPGARRPAAEQDGEAAGPRGRDL